jgi:hypothetical protein
VLAVYLLLAVWYTHPLVTVSRTHILGEPTGDPLLNASVVWWNATTLPLSGEWWNPPYFYPSHGIAAFTENLLGISPIATPIYWLSGSPLAAYNLAIFLAWPLSGFSLYLLARHLIGRFDAAFIAGLAFGFSAYRAAELGHIQMASSYWIPLMLLGLHRYLADRRLRWLALFGVCWLLQSLANLYMMLFGAVLIALWLIYFCSARTGGAARWRAPAAILAVWFAASLPLIPILLTYREVHDDYGLARALDEPLGYSNPLSTWFAVSGIVWLWKKVLPDDAVNHFPGATIVVLVVAGIIATLRARDAAKPVIEPRRRRLAVVFGLGLAAAMATVVATMSIGPWQIDAGGFTWLRVHDLYRAVTIAAVCGVGFWWLSPRLRDAFARRSLFLFYAAGTLAMATFAIGPVVPAAGHIVFEPAPYRFLMALPGFDNLRMPARFWMLGVLCLAVAAGFAFRALTAGRASGRRAILFAAVAAGLLIDAWPVNMNLVPAPWQSAALETPGQPYPILELPIGDGTRDAEATFRSIGHRRRILNGVSGYDPAHYAPLVEGITARDPELLEAISSLASFDVIVDESIGGDWKDYVAGAPGAVHLRTDGTRSAWRLPPAPRAELRLGDPLPIVAVSAIGGHPYRAIDGTVATTWDDGPQHPSQWFVADLGSVHDVGGVTTRLGGFARDYPRRLAIDLSIDAANWATAWEGRTAASAFLAAVEAPREAALRFALPPRPARYVRLRQLEAATNLWVIAELQVHRGP